MKRIDQISSKRIQTNPSSRRLHNLQQHIAAPRTQSSTLSSMSNTTPITSHVLDTSIGKPAANLYVQLYRNENSNGDEINWQLINSVYTNTDGRLGTSIVPANITFESGLYQMKFHTGAYFEAQGQMEYFYPTVCIQFFIQDATQHYHVPLLLSPFGYSTYRGS